jgi:hypothetical protein
MRFGEAMNTEFGSFVISLILGLGLSALFREVCKGQDCIIFEPPNDNYIQSHIFQFKSGCYKFKPKFTECKTKNGNNIIKKQKKNENLFNI